MATAWAASVFSGDLEHGFLLREQNAGFGPSLQPWPPPSSWQFLLQLGKAKEASASSWRLVPYPALGSLGLTS